MKNKNRKPRFPLNSNLKIALGVTVLALASMGAGQRVYAATEINTVKATAQGLRIYTDLASKGKLPASIRFSQELAKNESTYSMTYDLVVTEEISGTKREAYRQQIQQSANPVMNEIKVDLTAPNKSPGATVTYQVHFEKTSDNSQLGVQSTPLTSFGYTSSEATISNGNPRITAPVETYKAQGDSNTTVVNETWEASGYVNNKRIRGGQGVSPSFTLIKEGEEIQPSFQAYLSGPTKVMTADSEIPTITEGSTSRIELDSLGNGNYAFPVTYTLKPTGVLSLESGLNGRPAVNGGRVFSFPFMTKPGNVDLVYSVKEPVGVNALKVNLVSSVNVYGQFMTSYDSKTLGSDLFHILPALPDSMVADSYWNEDDVKWVKASLKTNWNGTKYTFKDNKWERG